jgi:CHAT domain-containing protein
VLPGTLKLDGDFTKQTFRAALRRGYPVVHVASHFRFRPGSEAESYLLLGDGGRLALSEVKALPNVFRGVDLLALSACETAVGGGGDGDGTEVEGFHVLAQRQGAKAVLATLWPVDDAGTRALMQEFYRVRRQERGVSKAEALRRAQVRLLRGGGAGGGPSRQISAADGPPAPAPSSHAHPYYWAPFVLVGNWR